MPYFTHTRKINLISRSKIKRLVLVYLFLTFSNDMTVVIYYDCVETFIKHLTTQERNTKQKKIDLEEIIADDEKKKTRTSD